MYVCLLNINKHNNFKQPVLEIISNKELAKTLSRVGRAHNLPFATILTYIYRFIDTHQCFDTPSSVKSTLDLAFL